MYCSLSTRSVCSDHLFELHLDRLIISEGGPGRSVGIATHYGLDVPESNPGEDEILRLFRLALWPTQPPVFPGGKVWPGCAADHSPPSSAAVMEE